MSFAEWEPSAAAMDGRGGCGNLLGARLEVIANGETALRGRAGCEMNPSAMPGAKSIAAPVGLATDDGARPL